MRITGTKKVEREPNNSHELLEYDINQGIKFRIETDEGILVIFIPLEQVLYDDYENNKSLQKHMQEIALKVAKKQIKKGTKENPYTHAPKDWHTNGVPWCSFCECSKCGYVGTSTITFDYYADNPGDLLICEHCTFGKPYYLEEFLRHKFCEGKDDS